MNNKKQHSFKKKTKTKKETPTSQPSALYEGKPTSTPTTRRQGHNDPRASYIAPPLVAAWTCSIARPRNRRAVSGNVSGKNFRSLPAGKFGRAPAGARNIRREHRRDRCKFSAEFAVAIPNTFAWCPDCTPDPGDCPSFAKSCAHLRPQEVRLSLPHTAHADGACRVAFAC